IWDRAKTEVAAAKAGKAAVVSVTSKPEIAKAVAAASAGPQPGGWQLRARDFDRVSGQLVSWDDKQVKLKAPYGEVSIPVKQVAEMWHAPSADIAKAYAASPKPAEGAGAAVSRVTEDIAFARKEDQVIPVTGVALGVDGASLRFRFQDAERKIALD